jgi:hypothetical protein
MRHTSGAKRTVSIKVMNKQDHTGDKPREARVRKTYTKPSFRCERVFETMALTCGKTGTQAICGRVVKLS